MLQSINKIALLTTGAYENSWYLMRKLTQQFPQVLIIITRNPPSYKQRLSFFIHSVKLTIKIILRYILLGQKNYLPVQPPSFSGVICSDDINAEIVYNNIKNFSPDLICISGTKIVSDRILKLAKLCLNLHHGFVPYYRGVSSTDWVSFQRNFDYYYVTVHEAVTALDSGPIYAEEQIKPYLFENYDSFKRRIKLFGDEIMLHVCQNLQTIKPVPQPDNVSCHNYRHKEKAEGFSIHAKREYESNNLRRYVINERDGGEGRLFHIVNRYLQKREERYALQPGLYIVNYHEIINHDDLKSDYKIPSIFTSIEKFMLHLKSYTNDFETVSMSDGLKLLQQGKVQKNRYLVITFDDGLSSVKDVLPYINAIGVKPTIFVSSEPLLKMKPLINHQELFCSRYSKYCKSVDTKMLRNKYQLLLREGYKTANCKDEFVEFVSNAYLSKESLRQMIYENKVEIGSHTSDHIQLSDIDYEIQYKKIYESHKAIERLLNTSIPYFSFPFGKLHHRDYCSEYIASYTAQHYFSCNGGINQTPGINGAILRIGIHNETVPALRSLLSRQRFR